MGVLMSTKEDRFEIYQECFDSLPLNQGELARLLNLGEDVTMSTRSKISDKLKGTEGRGVTKQEALAMQTLNLLHSILQQHGMSVRDIEFDSTGRITKAYTKKVLKAISAPVTLASPAFKPTIKKKS